MRKSFDNFSSLSASSTSPAARLLDALSRSAIETGATPQDLYGVLAYLTGHLMIRSYEITDPHKQQDWLDGFVESVQATALANFNEGHKA